MQAGKYSEAAENFLKIAAQSRATTRTDYQLNAAYAFLLAGEYKRLQRLLDKLSSQNLDKPRQIQLDILQAKNALAQHEPYKALKVLEHYKPEDIPQTLALDYFTQLMLAYTQAGNRIEAARARTQMEFFISDEESLRANRAAIWALLEKLHPEVLELTHPPAPDALGGWMELVAIGKRLSTNPEGLEAAITAWRLRYPNHPGADEVVNELEQIVSADTVQIENIALLLPLKGRFSNIATTIRDGFLTAFYKSQDPSVSIKIYDTSEGSIWENYHQAVTDGAKVIVGPLQKSAVETLAQAETLPIVTLALNNAPEQLDEMGEVLPATINLFQFSLNPEDEAEQIAEQAWFDGHTRAAILAPETNWGKRMSNAFNTAWQNIGGILADNDFYASKDSTLAQSVSRLLNIDKSKQRYRALKSRLVRNDMRFEPRRRQDLDMVFLAAFPRQGRQLRPQFQFYRASELPLYASSHIFSGNENAKADIDLNGIKFTDMPWILDKNDFQELRQQVNTNWPQRMRKYNRMFAFGIDAYNVLPYLPQLLRHRLASLQASSGILRADLSATIHRQLMFAEFINGLPHKIDTSSH